MENHISRLEIQPQARNSLLVVYFPRPFIVRNYWRRPEVADLRDKIIRPTETDKRDSVEEKVKSFMEDGKMLIQLLYHFDFLNEISMNNSSLAFLVFLSTNLKLWTNSYFIATVIINILLISRTGSIYFEYSLLGNNEPFSRLIRVFGLAQLLTSVCSIIPYSMMYGSLYVKSELASNPENRFSIHVHRFIMFLVTRLQKCFKFKRYWAIQLGSTSISFPVHRWIASLYYYVFQFDSLYYWALAFFSVMGFLHSPLWFALSLIQMLRMFKDMSYVSLSFTSNISQVVATIVLAAVVIYFFVIITFAANGLLNEYNINGHQGCYSLNSCFRMHIDFGVTTPLDWSGTHIQSVGGELYNFFYVFIIQIVIPGIISGIIIDTFASQRQANDEMNEDVENTCFICNIPREEFETSNITFEDHIKYDHNCWMYLWYVIYINDRDKTELNGEEQYCYQQIQKNMTKWLPLKSAKALSKPIENTDAPSSSLLAEVDRLEHALSSLNALQEKLDLQVTAMATRMNSNEFSDSPKVKPRSSLI